MRMTVAMALGVALCVAGAGVAGMDAAYAQESGATLIRGARVFDGERMVGVRDVLIERGRIARIAPRIARVSNATVVEGRGRTLLPGLIDAHVHTFPSAAADALRFGVTTEFDMFNLSSPEMVAARKAKRESLAKTDEADVWSAGMGVTPPGGHPTQMMKGMGVTIPTLAPDGDAAAFTKARVAEGSDYIKIFQDDGTAHGSKASLTPFPPAQLGAAIAGAHAAGVKAIVHVSKLEDARQAYAMGADAIAHIFQDRIADDAFVALAREKKAVVIATLSVMAGASGDGTAAALAADPAVAPHLSPMQKGMMAATFPKTRPGLIDRGLDSVRRLHAGGVTILAGTDAPNPSTAHGPTLHEELALLVRAGLTPSEALAAATSRPAAFFGTADRGRIAPGLRADLVLVDGDPTTRIEATRSIAGIWKNGFAVDRAKLPVPPPPPPGAAASRP